MAGFIAAGIQASIIGNVVAGFIFAALQSTGMTGAIASATTYGAASVAGLALSGREGHKDEKDSENTKK